MRKGSKAAKAKAKAATKVAEPKAASAPEAAGSGDKENAPLNKSTASKGPSAPPAQVTMAKPQPKKRTPFFIFCTEKRNEVREAHPDFAITEQVASVFALALLCHSATGLGFRVLGSVFALPLALRLRVSPCTLLARSVLPAQRS